MLLVKKFLIVITIIIFLVIIWRLIIIRLNLQNISETEGFSLFSSAKDNEVTSLESKSKINIKNTDVSGVLNLPLKELCVKASYNSASSGNYVNTSMLQYVINRGVRYLDFEVFYISDNGKEDGHFKPVVSTSTDPTFMVLNSENTVLLDTVLISAVANAFSSPCPNYGDPLFINLRIKSNNTDVYKAVASSIDNSIKGKIFVDHNPNASYILDNVTTQKAKKVTKDTLLKDIKGSVVLSIDKTIFPNYTNYTKCDASGTNCYDLTNYTNIHTGSQDMNLILYNMLSTVPTIQINDDNLHTTVQTITVTIPDNLYLMNPSNNNPDYADCVLKYSCQIVPYRFYHNDTALEKYEKFFNANGAAFVPLSVAISHFMNKYQ